MSKVLIDRAVLEATLEHAEFVSGAACEADDAIRAVLAAPSGTPVMPVKAYYHEAPNEHGGLNKPVGLEQRKTFSDAPMVLESDALAQIACLEGEIAKRDARIVELESGQSADMFLTLTGEITQLRSELAAIKAQEPVGYVVEKRTGSLTGLSGVIKASAILEDFVTDGTPLYAAPVSEAKAQGVVIPAELDRAFITGESCDGVYRVAIQSETLKEMQAVHSWLTRLNAAPAAPAADAPPESCRQRLAAEGKPYPRSSCAACGQFSPKWRECDAAIAAHRSKGVV